MAQKPTPEFRAEAARIALTSGLSRRQVAADLGIGFSTLSRLRKGNSHSCKPQHPLVWAQSSPTPHIQSCKQKARAPSGSARPRFSLEA